ncbi:twin-arginine translocase subunit TatC [Leptolyngbya sp. FACHB-261]|uniref:twin-arginine translocase subunit TatC n=1 Tax=Leptolyngbya sp. FACHB-261 TaxID=2692806 RepID=UPI0016859A8A|nr:twin-arginine translocase subunit TatC [Leptolyngbya sp. FACHB-261]MBD2104238.1 twin-arginine translocase subunit TatC [Leptolyngbya sp. FACHB-261]
MTSSSSSELASSELELSSGPLDEPEIDDPEDIAPDDVEMSLFDHLEELRLRIFYALAAMGVGIVISFFRVNDIVRVLEGPARGAKLIQQSPGEYFFVSLKVAAYSGILAATPFVVYQIVRFVLPGLTVRERRFLGPIVLGSTVLFLAGLFFAYVALIPAALTFFISYGADVVEQLWSIDRYFEFVLLLMFSTGLAFQVPVIQMLLGLVGIVNSAQMLQGWRYVILAAAILGAVLTPSTDPLTQSLLAGAVTGLYFSGIGLVKLLGR